MAEWFFEASDITGFQQNKIISWKAHGLELTEKDFLRLVEENHAFNYQLWHAEDRARRDDMGYEFVYQAKREIDKFNQQRNNRMEAMDQWLLTHIKPAHFSECPLHSETPGMIIDRLSIMSLKIYHMHEQAIRDDVDASHRDICLEKFHTLTIQREDLSQCFQMFMHEIVNKKKTFKVYYQLKMYNDPSLNPELYRRS